jgi:hypothetical protein
MRDEATASNLGIYDYCRHRLVGCIVTGVVARAPQHLSGR